MSLSHQHVFEFTLVGKRTVVPGGSSPHPAVTLERLNFTPTTSTAMSVLQRICGHATT